MPSVKTYLQVRQLVFLASLEDQNLEFLPVEVDKTLSCFAGIF